MKLFAILLFSIEMLAPAILVIATPKEAPGSNKLTVTNLSKSTQSLDLISHLIFEEISNEEREGRDDCLISLSFVEVFSELQKFEPLHTSWVIPKERFDIQPTLYTLHRVLLI